MPYLEWSDALAMDLPVMDQTHREFIVLLGAAEMAPDDQLLGRWRALVAHTDDHFAQEDQWMAATRFSSTNCHTTQHKVVLQVLREGLARGERGELDVIRAMVRELSAWFPHHAQAMDAALALHLRRVGYDPETGVVRMPQALPQEVIHGCGGDTCSEPATATPAEAVATPA